jgi:hypothetical protein
MMYAVHYHGNDADATREYYSDRRQALCRMLVDDMFDRLSLSDLEAITQAA